MLVLLFQWVMRDVYDFYCIYKLLIYKFLVLRSGYTLER